jgi:hypothetical protein
MDKQELEDKISNIYKSIDNIIKENIRESARCYQKANNEDRLNIDKETYSMIMTLSSTTGITFEEYKKYNDLYAEQKMFTEQEINLFNRGFI